MVRGKSRSLKASEAGEENTVPVHDESRSNLKKLRAAVRRNERTVAINEPEFNVIGEVESGTDFGSGVCCKWEIEYGSCWEHVSGRLEGQTHIDYPSDGLSVVWSHPLDVHFVAKGMHGWPRLIVQVWRLDSDGHLEVVGYGFSHLPSIPGKHDLSLHLHLVSTGVGPHKINIATWRPVGTLKEEISAQFLGGTPRLRDIGFLFEKAWSDRCRLLTTASGTVNVTVDVVLKNFHLFGVENS